MGGKLGIDEQIAQIAARQHGNVTTAQLHPLGLNNVAISYRVKAGRLHRVHRAVYAVGRPPVTPLERASAAVLASGPGAALSHGSAMTLWGLWNRWDSPFAVTVAGDRRPQGIRTYRSAGLLRRDVRVQLGIRVTSPARALLDSAPLMNAKSLTRAVNEARRAKLASLEALGDVVARFPLHPGAPLLAPHAGVRHEPTRSVLEDDFLEFCRHYGLPTPQVNVVVAGYEVDTYFEAERLIVELDSWGFHSDRHSFQNDRERDATTLALGIATVRITWERFTATPATEAARLRSILAMRAASAA